MNFIEALALFVLAVVLGFVFDLIIAGLVNWIMGDIWDLSYWEWFRVLISATLVIASSGAVKSSS